MDLLGNINTPGLSYTDGNTNPNDYVSPIIRQAVDRQANRLFEESGVGYNLTPLGDYKRYTRIGLQEDIPLLKEQEKGNLEKIMADAQGNLQKIRNSVIQTLSETVLGTAEGISNLFDISLLNLFKDNLYESNPVTQLLERWQEDIKEAAPIYADPDKSITNGGLFDVGFLAQGAPSVMSSLTLLVPSKGVSVGLGKAAKFLTGKGLRYAREAAKATKAEGAVNKATAAIKAAAKSSEGRKLGELADVGITATMSRLLENYQEGRQVYQDILNSDDAKNIRNMDAQQYNDWVQTIANQLDSDVDINDREAVLENVAKIAANETFKDDMINIFSDIMQVYALAKPLNFINGPARANLRRKHKLTKENIGKTDEEIKTLLKDKTKSDKAKEWIGDKLYDIRTITGAEIGEGVEEAINYIAQEEGMHLGRILLNNRDEKDNTFDERLAKYIKAPQLWDSAFWGLAGGIVFQKGGEYLYRAQNAMNAIKSAKEKQKGDANVKVPSFFEAFKLTEDIVRSHDIDARLGLFSKLKANLLAIKDGKDIYKQTENGVLETDEEKDIARRKAIAEHDTQILLNAMDAGNYDMAVDFLSSEEFKQALESTGLTRQEIEQRQQEVLQLGDHLKDLYDKNLRIAYNAASGWGDYNDADLSEMPAEYYQLVARENIAHELNAEYFKSMIDKLTAVDGVIEQELKDKLEAEGMDFKDLIKTRVQTQLLAQVNAQIKGLKGNKDAITTIGGQLTLKSLELQKRILEEQLLNKRAIDQTGEVIESDEDYLGRVFAVMPAVLSSRIAEDNPNVFIMDPNEEEAQKLTQAIEASDAAILKTLSPYISAILSGKTDEEATRIIEAAKHKANLANQNVARLYADQTTPTRLNSISRQLASNYRNIAEYEIARQFELRQIAKTKEEVESKITENIHILNDAVDGAIEEAMIAFQQLAKRYGMDEVYNEIRSIALGQGHTDVYSRFTDDERTIFDDYVAYLRLNRPENNDLLGLVRSALLQNNIYEFTEEEDIFKAIKEHNEKLRREAEESSATNQNSTQAAETAQPTTTSGTTQQAATERRNEQNGNVTSQSTQPTEQNGNVINDEEVVIDDSASSSTETGGAVTSPVGSSMGEAEADNSSTGEVDEEDIDDEARANALEIAYGAINSENFNDTDPETLKSIIRGALAANYPSLDASIIDLIVNDTIDELNDILAEKGTTYEAAMANNLFRLSTRSNAISVSTLRGRQIFTSALDKVLENYCNNLAIEKADGKVIVSLESLLRYLRNVTSNDDIANAVFDNLVETLKANPDKYILLDKNIDRVEIIANSKKSTEERLKELQDDSSGLTFNIQDLIGDNVTPAERSATISTLYGLPVGTKIQFEGNNPKILNNGKRVFGGISFVVEVNGKKTVVSRVPTARFGRRENDPNLPEDCFVANKEGWVYTYPFEGQADTHPIAGVLKSLLTATKNSKDANLRKFAKVFEKAYASYNKKDKTEYYKYAKELNDIIKDYIESVGLSTDVLFTNKNATDIDRINHLVTLRQYFENDIFIRLALDDSSTPQGKSRKRNNMMRQSVASWIQKLQNSDRARSLLEDDLNNPERTLEVVITKKSMGFLRTGKPTPVSEGIGNHTIHLAVGSTTDTQSFNAVRLPAPIYYGGNNYGNTAVFIEGPDGKLHRTNAYGVRLNSSNIKATSKMASIKKDLEAKFKTILNDWYRTKNSDAILAFITELQKGLFTGVSVTPLTGGYAGIHVLYTDANGVSRAIDFFDTVTSNGVTYKSSHVRSYVVGEEKPARARLYNPTHLADSDFIALQNSIVSAVLDNLTVKLDASIVTLSGKSTKKTEFYKLDRNGKFTITIDDKNYEFTDYQDFIVGENLIDVTTNAKDGSNFTSGNNDTPITINYEVVQKAYSPVEESNVERIPIKPLSTEIFTSNSFDSVQKLPSSKEIVNKILTRIDDTESLVKILKNSGIVSRLLHKNVIFVESFEGAREDVEGSAVIQENPFGYYADTTRTFILADGTKVKIKKGTIALTRRWAALLDGNIEDKREALRHLLHENIHGLIQDVDLLDKSKHDDFINQLRSIFNEFKNSSKYSEFDFDYLLNDKGEITDLGLEEFLVESLTNPQLIDILNNIDSGTTDVNKKNKSLFKKILDTITQLLNYVFDINPDSLLAKEYELFDSIMKTNEDNTNDETNEQEPSSTETTEIKASEDDIPDFDSYNFSTRQNGLQSYPSGDIKTIVDKLGLNQGKSFVRKINNGLINIICS